MFAKDCKLIKLLSDVNDAVNGYSWILIMFILSIVTMLVLIRCNQNAMGNN